MPIYEYVCRKCKNQFEELVLGQNDDPVTCPRCGSTETEKLMSCCRSKVGGAAGQAQEEAPAASTESSSSSCSSCTGCCGACGSCSH